MSVSHRTRRMVRLSSVSQEAEALCALLLTQLPGEEEFLARFHAFRRQLDAAGEMSELTPSQLFQTSVISALVYSLDFCLELVSPRSECPLATALRQAVDALSRFAPRFAAGPFRRHRVIREWSRLLRYVGRGDSDDSEPSFSDGPPYVGSSPESEPVWSD